MALRAILPHTAPQYLADNVYDLPTAVLKCALLASTYDPIGGWLASTAYGVKVIRQPSTPNGHYYQAQGAGTSAASEPTWPTNGSTVVDNDITWQDIGATLPDYGANDGIFGDVSGDEISGTGYTAGGETLTGVALTSDPSQAVLSANDVVWSTATFSARWAVIYHDATLDGVVKPIVGIILLDDTPADVSPAGVDMTLGWGLSGIVSVPALAAA